MRFGFFGINLGACARPETAARVARALEGTCGTGPVPDEAEVVVAGGGRKNRALMQELARRLSPRTVLPVDDHGVDGDFKEAVAFGDRRERVCAFVLLKPAAVASGLTLSALTAYLHDAGLAKFKWPERLEVIEEFPLTASGKLSKALLRERIVQLLQTEAATDIVQKGK